MHNTLRSVKLNVLCALVFNRPNDLLFQGYIRKYDTEAAFVGLQVFWHLKVSGLTGMLSRCTSGSCGSHIPELPDGKLHLRGEHVGLNAWSFMVSVSGFRVEGLGFWGFGFVVSGLGFFRV